MGLTCVSPLNQYQTGSKAQTYSFTVQVSNEHISDIQLHGFILKRYQQDVRNKIRRTEIEISYANIVS